MAGMRAMALPHRVAPAPPHCTVAEELRIRMEELEKAFGELAESGESVEEPTRAETVAISGPLHVAEGGLLLLDRRDSRGDAHPRE